MTITETDYKRCSKCGCTKPSTDFNKRSASKDGLQSQCKPCKSGYNKDRYVDKREHILEVQSVYRNTDKEHISRLKKVSYQRTKEHVLTYQRNYYKDNTDVVAQRNQQWVSRNRDKVRGYSSSYRARRASSFVEDVKLIDLIDRDGTKCSYCATDLEVGTSKVHMDHVWPLAKDGLHCMDNLTLACQSCNTSKGDKMPGDFVRVKGYEHLISPHVKEILDLIDEVTNLTFTLTVPKRNY